jgi:hypothetical protein
MVAAALLPEKGAMTTQAQVAKTPTGRQAPTVKSEAFNSPMPVCVKGLEPGTGGTTAAPEFLAVPVIVAAWILVVVLLDRWVRKGIDRE